MPNPLLDSKHDKISDNSDDDRGYDSGTEINKMNPNNDAEMSLDNIAFSSSS